MLRKALSINFNILKVVVDLKVKAVGQNFHYYCTATVLSLKVLVLVNLSQYINGVHL